VSTTPKARGDTSSEQLTIKGLLNLVVDVREQAGQVPRQIAFDDLELQWIFAQKLGQDMLLLRQLCSTPSVYGFSSPCGELTSSTASSKDITWSGTAAISRTSVLPVATTGNHQAMVTSVQKMG
jgi:hypothetical protein